MEIGFKVQYDSLPKQVQNGGVPQGSKGSLHPFHQGSRDQLCSSIKEAEACCSTAIREAAAQGASQASSIQQSHAKGIQHLEEEAIEEESKGKLNFLSTCQATLEASPLKSCGMLLTSYQVLLGHTLMSHLFSNSQEASPTQQGPALGLLPPLPILCPGLHPGLSNSINHQI